jgi:hypothetical protein
MLQPVLVHSSLISLAPSSEYRGNSSKHVTTASFQILAYHSQSPSYLFRDYRISVKGKGKVVPVLFLMSTTKAYWGYEGVVSRIR